MSFASQGLIQDTTGFGGIGKNLSAGQKKFAHYFLFSIRFSGYHPPAPPWRPLSLAVLQLTRGSARRDGIVVLAGS